MSTNNKKFTIMKFEKTNETVTSMQSYQSSNENYIYDVQVEILNGEKQVVTMYINKLVETEMPNPEGDPVTQKQPTHVGNIQLVNGTKRMDLIQSENSSEHVAVFEDFLSFLEDENS